jgi:hypothetical protein
VDEAYRWLPPGDVVASERRIYLCPQHPYRLMCDAPASEVTGWPGCVASHYATEHEDEHTTGRCFVCEAPLRDNFTPITAEVQLHRPIPFFDDNRARDHWFVYSGTLTTLPVGWLCPRHADPFQGPLR